MRSTASATKAVPTRFQTAGSTNQASGTRITSMMPTTSSIEATAASRPGSVGPEPMSGVATADDEAEDGDGGECDDDDAQHRLPERAPDGLAVHDISVGEHGPQAEVLRVPMLE